MTMSVHAFRGRRWTAWLVAATLAFGGAAWAQDSAAPDTAWMVKNRLQGKIKKGEAEKSEDASGLACAPGDIPRLCLAVDDETQGAQIVILEEHMLVAGEFIRLNRDNHKGKPLELDAEGVAYADGFFYVVGSHGRPRHESSKKKEARNDAKAAATRKIFRVALSGDNVDLVTGELKSDPKIAGSTALSDLLQKDPVLAPFFDRPLEENGISLEGLAVRDGDLYAALRGPVIDGQALIARVPLAAIFDGKAGALTLHRLALGTDSHGDARGIRALTAEGDGFLLIAGPENDPADGKIAAGDYAVYAWKDATEARKLLDLKSYGAKVKPEALQVLGRTDDSLHALLLFDGGKEGMPTPVDIPLR